MDEAKAKQEVDAAQAEKKAKDAEARRSLFQSEAVQRRQNEDAKRAAGLAGPKLAGDFRVKDHVVAVQDITIRGNLVVLAGTGGIVLGPAETDPMNRIAIDFVKRQDGGTVPINAVPKEIRRG